MAAWSLRIVSLLLGIALFLPLAPRVSAADEVTITVERGEATVTTTKDGTKQTARPGSPITLPKGSEFEVQTSDSARVEVRLGDRTKLELGEKTSATMLYDPDDDYIEVDMKVGSVVVDQQGSPAETFVRTPRGGVQPDIFSSETVRFGVKVDPESGSVTFGVEKGNATGRPRDGERFDLGSGEKLTITKDGIEKGALDKGVPLISNLDPLEPDRDGTKAQGSENPGTGKPEQPKDKEKEDDEDNAQQASGAITSTLVITDTLPAPVTPPFTSKPFVPKVPPSQLPVLNFEVVTRSVLEGNSGLQAVSTKLLLTPPSSQVVTVQIQSQDGTATVADGDYPAQSDLLTFLPGQNQVIVNSFWFGDTKVESQESFKKVLFNPKGATLGQSNTIFIFLTNDD